MSSRKEIRKELLAKSDSLIDRFVAFNATKGGGVRIEKRTNGYSLFREDNGRPVARLRPSSKDDLESLVEPHLSDPFRAKRARCSEVSAKPFTGWSANP